MAGFFKGMSFPLASIAVYSSVVFGVFSNTQRLLGQLRHGDASHAPALVDVALASTVAGFISVGIGTPVDLVKIRLQMQTQTQTYSTGRKASFPSSLLCRSSVYLESWRRFTFRGYCYHIQGCVRIAVGSTDTCGQTFLPQDGFSLFSRPFFTFPANEPVATNACFCANEGYLRMYLSGRPTALPRDASGS